MKKWLRPAGLVGIPLAVALVAGAIWLAGGRFVGTEDAYVKADKVPVSVEVAGTVREVFVRENEAVEAGDPLFRLDAAPFEVALAKAEAELARARTDVSAMKAGYREQQAQVHLAKTREEFARRDYKRQADLATKGYISATSLDKAEEAVQIAEQQAIALDHDLARVRATLGGSADLPIEQHPEFLAARAALAQAKLDLDHTTIRAPFTGRVSRPPKPGAWLAPGNPALALVGSDHPWVEANFTEKEMTHLRAGQRVDVRIDTYPGYHWSGVVDSISPATGAEFSVIPAQNATGNWVKITQRVPVRIELAQAEGGPELRAGLSAIVEVDTGRQRRLFGFVPR